ncbi:MAG: methionyl-tRNA formyltransferase [Chloroflexota bacterium]|nr:methionyl-tRNA formyltransferase [Chloroflexota bacterium]MEA2669553.1 methionyl-tRNA formyltransferase [Chloroflexota bacterium]
MVTQPDRVAGRGLKLLASGTKQLALQLGLEVFQPARIRDEAAQARIRQVAADVMVVVAYGQILPASLLNAPRLGTLNVHASLLPRHRGPAPIEWSILSGDTETGVTIMQMDAGVDTGPILAQARVPLGPDATAGPLEDQLANLGAGLMVETLDNLQRGAIRAMPQRSEGATHAPRLTSEDGKLKPATMSAQEIDRRVRALSERLGCWIALNGVEVKVIRGHLDGAAGDGIPVSTADGTYVVDEVQPPGGRRMTAAAWARGRR